LSKGNCHKNQCTTTPSQSVILKGRITCPQADQAITRNIKKAPICDRLRSFGITMDDKGKLMMECILETKAATILEIIAKCLSCESHPRI